MPLVPGDTGYYLLRKLDRRSGWPSRSSASVWPALGAEVRGVRLGGPLADRTVRDIHRSLLEHHVLFFRDQDLSDDEHLALAARFGEVSVFPIARLLAGSEVAARVSYIEDTEASPPDADSWHTDVTWIATPPAAAFLSARVIPPIGGDTIWSSLFAAYERLSPALQAFCEQLFVEHHYGPVFEAAITRLLGEDVAHRLRAAHPAVRHPLVSTHPVTGRKALYLSGYFMRAIAGLHPEESDVLLVYLKSLIDDPNLQVRWRWRANDLVIWDERCTNHRALSDHYPQHRIMRRCTVNGPLLSIEQSRAVAEVRSAARANLG
jgi:taurine dioxygenase